MLLTAPIPAAEERLEEMETQIGSYRLTRLLGAGGGGLVFEAQHVHLRKKVALKMLRADACDSPEHVERFLAEAQVIAELRHPHVVTVHDAGTTAAGRPYYVMDLMEGLSLTDYVRANGRLLPEDALRLLTPIASALGIAHRGGVIHRDVKPSNIFLEWTEDGEIRARLCDFGIAKLMRFHDGSGVTTEGRKMGTPIAMSPEQIRGEQVDPRADIYGLGIVLYYCLAGRYPFVDADPRVVEEAHLYEVPPPLDLSSSDREVGDLVLWCLEKEPTLRPEHMAVLERAMIRQQKNAAPSSISAWALLAAPRSASDEGPGEQTAQTAHQGAPLVATAVA